MRSAILLVIVTLMLAGAVMWACLPAQSAPRRHYPRHKYHPAPLPPVRPNTSLDAQIGRWLAGQLGAPWR